MTAAIPIQQRALEDQEDREIAQAISVEHFLADPVIRGVLDSIDREWSEAWRKSAPHAVEVREKAYTWLLVMDEFRARLASIVDSGKLANKARSDRIAQQRANEQRRRGER